MTIERLEPRLGEGRPRMSSIVVHNDTVYLAGQVAKDPKPDIKDQTRQILDNIERQLAVVGSDKSKILSTQIWITDFQNFADMNEVWNAWVDPDNMPVRACVQSALARSEFLIEIMVVAAK